MYWKQTEPLHALIRAKSAQPGGPFSYDKQRWEVSLEVTIELYCGFEKPFSKIADALGYATTTIDPNPDANATITGAIVENLASQLPGSPLIVWAAPPFSKVLTTMDDWEADGSFSPKTQDAHSAINHLSNTIGLIYLLKPSWWFIEQPKSLVRKMPLFGGFNRGYPTRNRQTIVHRQFGGEAAGVSDVWTNAFWWLPNASGNSEPEGGNQAPTSRLPPNVYAQMFEQFENYRSKSA